MAEYVGVTEKSGSSDIFPFLNLALLIHPLD